ncbi:MAG: GIY-YIG nuclease family protein [Microgenomates group bacterium]
MNTSFIYILTNKRNGTLYIGVTSNLKKRVYQHKLDMIDGFSQKYKTHILVYYEVFDSIELAIQREKQLKEWKRNWKLELIENKNADWNDLYNTI